ncbi:unnamed protein product [Ilex paraguariensis]|uniref:NPH3 domain-containing protein n=1 Tax=Ilex paraguariensis TaxID=185542 RepID=A0ABC8RC28_9AQUA
MACMKIGSKSKAFHHDGQTWQCTTGLPSDVTIEFPLLSRSGLLEKLIGEFAGDDGSVCILRLDDIPGGAKAFELIAKFCYGVKIELTALNVVSLRCAAEYLHMSEDHGEENLTAQTEAFLNEVFGNWSDTVKALKTCEEVLSYAEELHIISRCINSLAMKACSDPTLFNWPVSECNNTENKSGNLLWNGISASTKPPPIGDDWWYEDVSFLGLPLYRRLIHAVEPGGMKPENVAGSLMFYAKKYIPLMNRQPTAQDTNQVKPGSTLSNPSEAEQRALLEEIVELLPNQREVTPTKFLLRLLRTAMILQASPSCRENLEKRVGEQLDQAALEDLLIPNMGYSVETLYDIDCFQRILDHFVSMDQPMAAASPCIVDEGQLIEGAHSLASVTMVANLVDAYLAEVALDVNLKFPKFQSLGAAIPDYARTGSDGIYRAIDIFLKAHPWLTDSEREQICRLMDCQKLSLEASTHAAQNERLPLRVIVQVLFFEQLRLRTSVSSWFFVHDNLENSENPNVVLALSKNDASHHEDVVQDRGSGMEVMKERVSELEKECQSMKQEIHKLVKTRRSWNIFCRRKSQHCRSLESKPCKITAPLSSVNERRNHQNGELGN